MKKVTGKAKTLKDNPLVELWDRQNPFGTRSRAALIEKLAEASLIDIQQICVKAGLSATLPVARLKDNILHEFDKFINEELYASQAHQFTVMGKPLDDPSILKLRKQLQEIHAG